MNKIELYKHIIDVFGDKKKAKLWLNSNIIALNNKTPYNYIKEGKLEEINNILFRIEYGIYS